jgi:2-polyprenyl-6-methoxyphenol hydroxylase-like FAD-dependent oxidoreductase
MARTLDVVVIGGSAAGLFTSLLLARAGHRVSILEQETFEASRGTEDSEGGFRVSAPQVAQPHVVLAKCRELMMQALPDVYTACVAAGMQEAPLSSQVSPSVTDFAPEQGDERLTLLMTRRVVLDRLLREAVRKQHGIQFSCGERVLGLLARRTRPPHVEGVRTESGMIQADLVVDATGYRSQIDHWIREIGADVASKFRAECGAAYFSRHYRQRDGSHLPGLLTTRKVVPLDEFGVGIWGADNGIMQLAVVPLARDSRFKVLRDPDVFTALLRTIPFFAEWVNALEPITGVLIMGAVQNTMRRLVVNAAPIVTGLIAVGDAICTTNPTLGRGLSVALSSAVDLLHVLERHPDDAKTQALAMDKLIGQHVLPFYQDQIAIDSARLASLEHTIFRGPAPEAVSPDSHRITFDQLRAASMYDAFAFRSFWKVMGMMSKPEDVYKDPQVVSHTHRALAQYGAGPSITQPTRDQLHAALQVGRQQATMA